MSASGLALHLINGLASAASLFLLASGLSLIFGVTRVLNFAHGSFFMLGLYLAYDLSEWLTRLFTPIWPGLGFWLAIPIAAGLTAAMGALLQLLVLRPVEGRNELIQLLATFAVMLLLQDFALWVWGPEDLLGMRAPGLSGSLELWGQRLPTYDVFLMLLAPVCWWLLHQWVNRSAWGMNVRAATEDRQMTAALGIRPQWLFVSVLALGCGLAGLGGALQLPREPASLALDVQRIGDAFAVVIIGGMGSIHGAGLAALLITAIQSICVALGTSRLGPVEVVWSQWSQALTFALMVVVLIWRPWGLLGRPLKANPVAANPGPGPATTHRRWWLMGLWLVVAWPWLQAHGSYAWVLGIDVAIAMLYASGLRLLLGPAGLHTFGHAAYFGLGAYAAAALHLGWGWDLIAAAVGAVLVSGAVAWALGALCINHLGVYLAMITLSMAQVVWAVAHQWESVTGGSNGLTGVWPSATWQSPEALLGFGLALNLAVGWGLHRLLRSPAGLALQAAEQSPQRAWVMGLPVKGLRWSAFVLAGALAGASGALFVFAKGSVSPQALSVSQSIDGLLMVMLGGWQHGLGAVLGATAWVGLHDALMRSVTHWRAAMGLLLLLLVMGLPRGLAGLLPQGLNGEHHARTRRPGHG